jgi:hypothetical protein
LLQGSAAVIAGHVTLTAVVADRVQAFHGLGDVPESLLSQKQATVHTLLIPKDDLIGWEIEAGDLPDKDDLGEVQRESASTFPILPVSPRSILDRGEDRPEGQLQLSLPGH